MPLTRLLRQASVEDASSQSSELSYHHELDSNHDEEGLGEGVPHESQEVRNPFVGGVSWTANIVIVYKSDSAA